MPCRRSLFYQLKLTGTAGTTFHNRDVSEDEDDLPEDEAREDGFAPINAYSRHAAKRDVSLSGCADVTADVSAHAGAIGSFFGLFDKTVDQPLFDKSFQVWQKCWGNGKRAASEVVARKAKATPTKAAPTPTKAAPAPTDTPVKTKSDLKLQCPSLGKGVHLPAKVQSVLDKITLKAAE
jgi:hypothetical protein